MHSYIVPADQVTVMLTFIISEYKEHLEKPGTGKLASLSIKHEIDLTGCLTEVNAYVHAMWCSVLTCFYVIVGY